MIERLRLKTSKWCAFTSLAILTLSLIPQVHLWFVRGSEWNGTYATMQGDEFLYSAYVNALIEGRPRLNDPFAGINTSSESPLPESSFSIQFVPPYLIALPARVLGISTSTAFIVLIAVTALLASCSVFWLLSSVTTNPKTAAAGVLVVLCLGELAGDQGIVGVLLLDHKLSVLVPYLRRYQPALALPLFFVFCTLVYRALSLENNRRARIEALLAGLVLVVLVFSYLYMWTAAAAWLAGICALWVGFRFGERRRVITVFTIAASMMILALIPYAYLVTRRSKSLDDAQIMVFTRQLDLFHPAELIGAVILAVLIIGWWFRKIKLREGPALFTASLAVLPFIVFNQQVVTGRSMQPFHYDLFVVNYVMVISLVILTTRIWREISTRKLVWIAVLCFSWGMLEMGLLAKARVARDFADDTAVPVLVRLKELARDDRKLSVVTNKGRASAILFSPHVDVMRIAPTWTSQGTLLGAGAQDFGTASRHDRKELLFLQLYYSEIDPGRFRDLLNQRANDLYLDFYAPSVIFGDDRFIPALTLDYRPIQQFEIERAVREYEVFISSISLTQVLARPLSYLVIRAENPPSLSNLDHWYERDTGERLGDYTLFKLTLRR